VCLRLSAIMSPRKARLSQTKTERPAQIWIDMVLLFAIRNGVPFAPVLNGLEFKQTQVFAFFPMPVGFHPDVDGRPVRNDVCALQQTSRVELARLSVWPKALRFWVVLV